MKTAVGNICTFSAFSAQLASYFVAPLTLHKHSRMFAVTVCIILQLLVTSVWCHFVTISVWILDIERYCWFLCLFIKRQYFVRLSMQVLLRIMTKQDYILCIDHVSICIWFCPQVTLRGWQDINIQALSDFRIGWIQRERECVCVCVCARKHKTKRENLTWSEMHLMQVGWN